MSDDILHDVGILRLYEMLTGNSSSSAMIGGLVKEIRSYGGTRVLRCPEPDHEDLHPSCIFYERSNSWKCLARGTRGTMLDLIRLCIGIVDGDPKAANRAAIQWLRGAVNDPTIAGRVLEFQPAPDKRFADGRWVKLEGEKLVATYSYTNLDGSLRYQVLRFEGLDDDGQRAKRFTQRRPLPAGGRWEPQGNEFAFLDRSENVHARTSRFFGSGDPRPKPTRPWAYDLDGVERIPYRLRELVGCARRGMPIIIPEGENKVDLFRSLGFGATCNAEGAGFDYFEVAEEWLPYFAGASAVYTLPDSDETGRFAAKMRARALAGAAPLVTSLDVWPDAPRKYDVINWVRELPRMNNEKRAIQLRSELNRAIERSSVDSKSSAIRV